MSEDNNYTGNEDGAVMLQWLRGQRAGINPVPPQQGEARNNEPFPPLTFRAAEWRMVETQALAESREMGAPLDETKRAVQRSFDAALDREDAIMSAVRAVARGS